MVPRCVDEETSLVEALLGLCCVVLRQREASPAKVGVGFVKTHPASGGDRERLGEVALGAGEVLGDAAKIGAGEEARARARRSMVFERIVSLDEEPALHDGDTLEERLAAMAALCRRAWLATGRTWPSCPRAELPGNVFRIEHARP